MAKRLSPEEKRLILADLRRYNNQKATAKKFKRSLGTINGLHKEMERLDSMTEDDIKEEQLEDTLFFLKQIDILNDTHTERLNQSIFDAMTDDTMLKIIETYKMILLSKQAANVSVSKNGITPFTQAIEMISRQNVNIATHKIKDKELSIKLKELEIKEKELELKILGSKPTDSEIEEEELETDIERSLYDALNAAMQLFNEEGADFDSMLEPDSLEALPKTDEEIEREALDNV